MPSAFLALVPILPFLAALVAPLLQRALGAYAGWVLALLPALIFAYLLSGIGQVSDGSVVSAAVNWVPALGLSFGLRLDGLSMVFALSISGIGALILLYSAAYLKGHPHQGRFLSFLLMFTGSMLGLVLADNLVALFVFWELTSVTSFLLIGFDHTRQAARRAAIQALVITGIGGLGLLVGIVGLNAVSGVWELGRLLDAGQSLAGSAAYPLLLFCFLIAAFTKSAQFPLHFWLPNAMEAPTPVSAFLHSATMVQAGVYLLARMTPLLGGTPIWTALLCGFGAVTLLWGAVAALKQTDLKQMLAQTTVASLGLLVLLIGIGTKAALIAAAGYFVAHALYKAALFMAVGIVDHETGTRDLTLLGGLREKMAAAFIVTALAALSMIGLPPALGYVAKEEMYLALQGGDPGGLILMAITIVGNAALVAVALAVVLKPFMGPLRDTPKPPHDGPPALMAGPLVLGLLGLAVGLFVAGAGDLLLVPAAASMFGTPLDTHLHLALNPLSLVFWLSVLTWALGLAAYATLTEIRTVLRRVDGSLGWSFDRAFDAAMFGLIRGAGALTRMLQHGKLEIYLVTAFAIFAVAALSPLLLSGALPHFALVPDLTFFEWGIVLLALAGLVAVVAARTRLFAIVALGVQGQAVAMLFVLFGAPDLSFTQFMVENLSVIIIALVMTRLKLELGDERRFEDLLRDGGLALLCGLGLFLLLASVLDTPFDSRLADFFVANSVPLAHGNNIVNVILVDFRGLDTLGEICVVMAAGIGVLSLVRGARRLVPAAPTVAPAAGRARRPRRPPAKKLAAGEAGA